MDFQLDFLSAPIPAFISYFLGGLFYLILFIAIYVRVTPFSEFKMIREGNVAAAITLSGAVLGFSLPLRRAIEQSVSAWDLALWATVALVAQIVTFLIFVRLMPKTVQKVEANQQSKAILLAAISIAIGLLNAASMTE